MRCRQGEWVNAFSLCCCSCRCCCFVPREIITYCPSLVIPSLAARLWAQRKETNNSHFAVSPNLPNRLAQQYSICIYLRRSRAGLVFVRFSSSLICPKQEKTVTLTSSNLWKWVHMVTKGHGFQISGQNWPSKAKKANDQKARQAIRGHICESKNI